MEKPEDQVSLLAEEDGRSPPEYQGPRHSARNKFQVVYLAFLHFAVLSLCLATFYLWYRVPFLQIHQSSSLYSPVNDIIEYETVVFYDNIFDISPYQGSADDEKDRLWKELYRDTRNTIISAESASKLPNKTVLLAESGGKDAVISFEVFHQLHCLDALRQSLDPHRFPSNSAWFPNGTRNAERTRHHEHCIDRIRQGIQCASDVGTIFWQWHPEFSEWQLSMSTTHTCRNFEAIRKWAVEREYTNWDTKAPPI